MHQFELAEFTRWMRFVFWAAFLYFFVSSSKKPVLFTREAVEFLQSWHFWKKKLTELCESCALTDHFVWFLVVVCSTQRETMEVVSQATVYNTELKTTQHRGDNLQIDPAYQTLTLHKVPLGYGLNIRVTGSTPLLFVREVTRGNVRDSPVKISSLSLTPTLVYSDWLQTTWKILKTHETIFVIHRKAHPIGSDLGHRVKVLLVAAVNCAVGCPVMRTRSAIPCARFTRKDLSGWYTTMEHPLLPFLCFEYLISSINFVNTKL